MSALPVRLAHELDVCPEERRWLIEGLWAAEAVGIVGGEPKCCLCRARHKQHYAASRIMPRPVGGGRVSAGAPAVRWGACAA